ncbi:MAG: hypothetical protein EXR79_06990 [Myxococcales bacterium]|nr:hypothetical protein [Myxococcales bacterium]
MATFKCEIKKQYGKFAAHVWRATEKGDVPVAKDLPTLQVAIDKVLSGAGQLGYTDGDEVIFRDTAYATFGDLKAVMLRSPY